MLDMELLALTAAAAMKAVGIETIGTIADREYFEFEDIESSEVPSRLLRAQADPEPAAREGFFTKQELRIRLLCLNLVCRDCQKLPPWP